MKYQIVGKNIAELCKKVDIDNIVFDKGAYNYNGRVKALADSCREFGLKF
jgi:large subunit ribosomal protein L18